MKIPLQKFWMILYCWIHKIPVQQATNLCGQSELAIRHWYNLFRTNLPLNEYVLEKKIQMDEAYFGGKRHGHALIMAKQAGQRKLAFEIIKASSVQRHHAVWFLFQYIKPKSKLLTDGSSIYGGIHRWYPIRHQRDIHRKWEFELTSEIEGMFGNLRTFIRRMYHHVTLEKLPEIVGEFCFRFCHPEIFDSPLKYLERTLSLVPFD